MPFHACEWIESVDWESGNSPCCWIELILIESCVCEGVGGNSEWLSTEQPVRHNTGHQQSLPHTGYQHGTALGTRSVLQETSSNVVVARVRGSQRGRRKTESELFLGPCSSVQDWLVLKFGLNLAWCGRRTYLLLVQLEGGLNQVSQSSQLLFLLVLSLFNLWRRNAAMRKEHRPMAAFTWDNSN